MSDKKVTLATFLGGPDGGQLEIDGEFLQKGVQREVTAKLAKRLEDRRDVEVIRVAEGSAEDVRAPEPVVPVQPEEEPAEEPEPEPEASDEEAAAEEPNQNDQPDETPHDTPGEKE